MADIAQEITLNPRNVGDIVCPACKGNRCDGFPITVTVGGGTLESFCLDCGASWVAMYSYIGFSSLYDEKGHEIEIQHEMAQD